MENTMMNNVEEAMEMSNMPATTEDIIDETKKVAKSGKGKLLKIALGAAVVFAAHKTIGKKIKKKIRNGIKDIVREVMAEEAAKEQASPAEAEVVSEEESTEED